MHNETRYFQLKHCMITPKISLSYLGGVRISNYLRYYLNKQLNFENLALWLWKKVTRGVNFFAKFTNVLASGIQFQTDLNAI